ncbi:MAG: diguanylate cyclase [Peptococcaceae bacterium]|nr:diguanylate cyclase [Peptococcaceae bacterium]
MPWLIPAIIAVLASTLVLAFSYSFLYLQHRQRFMGLWLGSWLLQCLRYALDLWQETARPGGPAYSAGQVAALLSACLLLWGTCEFLGRRPPAGWQVYTAATAVWIAAGTACGFTFWLQNVPVFVFLALAHIWTGAALLKSRELPGFGRHLTGWSLVLWGLHRANYPLLRPLEWFAPWGYLIASVLALLTALGMILVYYQRMSQDLLLSEEKYRRLTENARDIIYRYRLRPEPAFDYINPVVAEITGYTPAEFYADPALIFKIIHPEDRPLLTGLLAGETRPAGLLVLRWLGRDGREIWGEHQNIYLPGPDGQLAAIEGISRDITAAKLAERKLQEANEELEATLQELRAAEEELRQQYDELQQAEQRQREAYRRLEDVIESLPDPTLVVDRDGKITAWNRAIEKMTGTGKADMLGRGDHAYALPFYGARRPALLDVILKNDRELLETFNYQNVTWEAGSLYAEAHAPALHNGRGAYLWIKASPLYDQDGRLAGAIETIRDITERKRLEDRLRFLSACDHLTGLHNRFSFDEEIKRLETAGARPVGIVVCDLDGLKLVNDALGQEAGDMLLVNVANLLLQNMPSSGLVARIGGDEFAAVFQAERVEELMEECCRRLRQAIDDYNYQNPSVPLSLAIGWAAARKAERPLAETLREAHQNMRREKLFSQRSHSSSVVQALAKMLEARDFITEGHAERIVELVEKMAQALGLPPGRMLDLRLFARFHDLGKVGVPDRILFKPGRLTAEEYAEMKLHCEIGYRIAHSLPELAHIAGWILKHHEWWNGRGYPLGLKGEEIPLECRMLAIADAFDAMTSDRPYRKALTQAEALAELKKCAGSQFDPKLVDLFAAALAG